MKNFLKDTIQQAGDIALKYYNQGFEIKTKSHKNDLLTEADEAVSEFLVKNIKEKYPDHKILSEELPEAINPKSSQEWVIDPIDGTFNFAKGMHIWAVMIAYLEDGEAKISAVYFPVTDELYFAEKDSGAYLNDERISVSETESLDHSVGTVYYSSGHGSVYGEYIEKYKKAVADMALNSGIKFTNPGSIAGLVCYFAKGSVDFMFNNAGQDWDHLPTLLIAEESGAIITNSHGEEWSRGEQDIVVANPNIHSSLLEFFKPV